ncbi:MAG: class I SAM-dependent methyltransferase [Candidatus Micrarchaeota archaeon]
MALESADSAAWERAYARRRIAWRGTTNFAPQLSRGARVLEIGCGNGKNLSALAGKDCEKNYEIHAVDYSPQAIALCKQSPVLKNAGIKFEVMDARALRFKNNFFDAVACFHVLGNMLAGDRKQAAREAQRVLKNGGKLFFKEFGRGDFRFGRGIKVERNSFKRRTGIVTHYFEGKNEGRNEVKELFGELELRDFESERWTVRYAGEALQREEINAVFIKSRRSV